MRLFVSSRWLYGSLERTLSLNNFNVVCTCIIGPEHELHETRLKLNEVSNPNHSDIILEGLSGCCKNLLSSYVIEFDDDEGTKQRLINSGLFSSIENDERCSITGFDDESYIDFNSSFNQITDSLLDRQYGIELCNFKQAWELSDGLGIKIAVLDTGIATHNDLNVNLIPGINFTSEDSILDENGHGNHVTGRIAAALNGSGIVGGAYACKVAPVKVLGKGGGGFSSDIVKGILWAADKGFNIANLSLGPFSLQFSKDAFDYADEKGMVCVMAAGNSGSELPATWGAAYDKNISVGNSTKSGGRHGSSTYGDLVDVNAPGTRIISCGLTSNVYTTKTGTSMAAPLVSALVALLLQKADQKLSLNDVREILKGSGDTLNTDKPIGNRINALAALQRLDGLPLTPNPDEGDELIDIDVDFVELLNDGTLSYDDDTTKFSIKFTTFGDAFQQARAIYDDDIFCKYNPTNNTLVTKMEA